MSGNHELLPLGEVPDHTPGHEPKHGKPGRRWRRRPGKLGRVLADFDNDVQAERTSLRTWQVDGDLEVIVLGDMDIAIRTRDPVQRVSARKLADTLREADRFRNMEAEEAVISGFIRR